MNERWLPAVGLWTMLAASASLAPASGCAATAEPAPTHPASQQVAAIPRTRPKVADGGPRCRADMDLDGIDAVVRDGASDVQRSGGVWEFAAHGVNMAIVTDVKNGRMRILAPIVREADLGNEGRRILLAANFHSALDARYATSDGIVYAAFIHPLPPLTADELRSAIAQVASLVHTFGTSYSSTGLQFGG